MTIHRPAPETGSTEDLRFGPYVATRELGRGGMSVVHEARHPRLDKRVAVKVMHGSLAGDPIAGERFLREAQAIARLAHPHVVEVFDVGFEEGRPYIVMELLEGETLEAMLGREGRFAVGTAVDLFMPVLSAVAAIHDGAVTHRDLKPGNVILARRGRFAVDPVVLDFGVSRREGEPTAQAMLTDPNVLVGTLPYLSPEQLRDARSAGPGGDQYAIGVMLYECLTGKRPFADADRYELMHAVMTAPVAPPSALAATVPRDLDLVVLRAMSRNPAARFPSVRALGGALLSFGDRSTWKRWASEFAGVDSTAGAGASASVETEADARPVARIARDVGSPPPPRRRRRIVAATAIGGAVLALGALALVARGGRQPQRPQPQPMTAAAPALISAPAPSATSIAIAAPASAIPRMAVTETRPVVPASAAVEPAPRSASGRSAEAKTNPRAAAPGHAGAPMLASPRARARPRPVAGDDDNDAIDPFQPLR